MMTKLVAIAFLLALALPANAAEYPLQCGRVLCSAEDGVMTKEGKYVLVTVNPSRFRFTYACWRTFDTLAEARAAERKASGK